MKIIQPTTTRVERNTEEEINAGIRRDTEIRIAAYKQVGPHAIRRRLDKLDREWDIERTLEANAAAITLLSLFLGKTKSRLFYAVPAFVAGFLLQHAVQGWCPPLPVLRRLGVRTPQEIEEERRGLLAAMRGRRRH